jgi:single-strand DNA-binding protein
MAGSINKVILVGNLGKDPEIRATQDGREICNLTLATSETWKDKSSGERKEKTEWHRVVIFNDGLVNVAKNYLRKGSKIYIEGSLQTRKWTNKEGQDQYSTEVVLQGYGGNLTMLDGKNSGEGRGQAGGDYQGGNASYNNAAPQRARVAEAELDDEIPF